MDRPPIYFGRDSLPPYAPPSNEGGMMRMPRIRFQLPRPVLLLVGMLAAGVTAMTANATSTEDADFASYRASILEAGKALAAGDAAAATAALHSAPVALRGWEWRYLEAEADLSETTFVGHDGPIRSLAVSPNGRFVTSASDDGTVRIWSFENGACLDTLADPGARSLDISTLVPLLAVAGSDIRLLDLPAGTERARITVGSPPLAVCFGGKTLAAGCGDGSVRFWDAASGTSIAEIPLRGGRHPIRGITSFGDPNVFACLLDSSVVVYDFANRQVLFELGGRLGEGASIRPTRFDAVASSPSGRWLAAAGVDSLIHLWDSDLLEERFLAGHSAAVSSVALDVRALRLASGSLDGTARAWDLQTMAFLGVMRGHRGAVTAVAFHPNSQHLVTGDSTGEIKVWDVLNLSAEEIDPPAMPVSIDWAPNHLAVACADSTVRVYEIAPLRPTFSLQVGRDARVRYSRDGGRLFTAEAATSAKGGSAARIRSWDAATGALLREFDPTDGRLVDLELSPDGRLLAGANEGGAVLLWDSVSGRLERTLATDGASARALSWSSDGRLLAIGRADGRLELREVGTGKAIASARGVAIVDLAMLPDGVLLSTGEDGLLREWRLDRDALRETGRSMPASSGGFALNPAADRVLLPGDQPGSLRVLDPRRMEEVGTLACPGDATLLRFDPSGEQLAVVRKDGTIRLLSAARGLPEAVDARD